MIPHEKRTGQEIPPEVLRAIDHVREFFPVVDMVAYNAAGRWQFMGEDFQRVKFEGQPIRIDILEDAAEAAGGPSLYHAYTSE